ncbi:hypothetical protein ES707_15049 [subsurface metagenome]
MLFVKSLLNGSGILALFALQSFLFLDICMPLVV